MNMNLRAIIKSARLTAGRWFLAAGWLSASGAPAADSTFTNVTATASALTVCATLSRACKINSRTSVSKAAEAGRFAAFADRVGSNALEDFALMPAAYPRAQKFEMLNWREASERRVIEH